LTPPEGLSVRSEYLWFAQEYFQDHTAFSPSPVQLICTKEQQEDISSELARWPEGSPVWIIAPGSYWKSKTCRFETLLEIVTRARKRFSPYYIFIAGTTGELSLAGRLAEKFSQTSHVLFRPDLVVLQHIMSRAQTVVSMDSLVLHLAATTQTPTFGLFGPSSAKRYGPEGASHGFYVGSCPFDEKFIRRCPHLRTCEQSPCLHNADPEAIFEALSSWYEEA
jgi:heptosyltransferase-1